ncbi:MAG: Gfo/Idh/MocA family oxidoreductase [Candidatus Eisenbacteria bacterium]
MEPVSIALVGTGDWGANLLRNFALLPACRVVAVCDADPARLERAKAVVPQAVAVADARELLEVPGLEAVVIAAPAPAHARLARLFLEAGKDVYVEKPFTLDVADAEALVALAEADARVLMVGHLLIHHPAVRKLKELVDEGELGTIQYVYSQRLNLGKVRSDENALWSFAPHDLSVMLHLLGGEPVEVSANGGAFLQKGIEDVVFAALSWADGRLAHVHVSWLDPHKVRRFTVVGSRRMATFDDMEPVEKVRVHDRGVDPAPGTFVDFAGAMTVRHGDVTAPPIDGAEPLKLECQHFVDCVRSRQAPLTGGRDGLRVIRVLAAAQASLAAHGAPVRLDAIDARATRRDALEGTKT